MVLKPSEVEQLDRRRMRGLVRVPDRDEHGARARQAGAAADLALGEGDLERGVDAHHLAGRFHLRPEHGVDAREAGEGEHRLLHRRDA